VNLTALAHRVILSWGWTRAFIAFSAGAVAVLSMPPFGFLPALFVSLAVAVWLLDGAVAGGEISRRLGVSSGRLVTLRAAAVTGWWFGFGFFVATLWWLGAAFLVDADVYVWAMPFGVLILPALLAFFPAFGFALARLVWSPGAARVLALAFGLAAADWLRGHLFTGFPWNSFGMALAEHLWLSQVASAIGLYGLGVVAVATAGAFATLGTGTTAGGRWLAPVLSVAVLAGLSGFGAWRLPMGQVAEVPGVKLRIMQPNVAQDAKFRPENSDAIMRRYLTLSDRATSPISTGVSDITHLIWPESAFPFLLARTPAALAQIGALLPPGTTLITGAARAEPQLPGETGLRFFNSMQVVADNGVIIGTYDKVHLLPFGEYLPWGGLLQRLGIKQFVNVPGGFEAGTRPALLSVRGLPPVAPLICYEAIFPGAVVPEGRRPGLLLNVTNDAWFGDTPGPRQHFAQSRLRTIEEGLPLVRAANTGISAVVDPYGRTLSSLPVGIEGVIDSHLPAALSPTLYGRFGDVIFLSMLVACLGAALVARRLG